MTETLFEPCTDEVVYSPDMAKQDDILIGITEIKTHLGYHKLGIYGIGIATLFLYAYIFLGKKDNAGRQDLASLSQEVVRLTAQLATSGPDAARVVPEVIMAAVQDGTQLGYDKIAATSSEAARQGVNAPLKDVRAAGAVLTAAPGDDPSRKKAMFELASYASSLTIGPEPYAPVQIIKTRGVSNIPFQKDVMVKEWGAASSPETGSWFGTITGYSSQLAAQKRIGPNPTWAEFDFQGQEITLDGQLLRNVVIKNAKIIYRGGPVNLDKVIFSRCVFVSAADTKPDGLLRSFIAADEVQLKSPA